MGSTVYNSYMNTAYAAKVGGGVKDMMRRNKWAFMIHFVLLKLQPHFKFSPRNAD